jgi:signal transduction histidine kinase
MTRPLRQLRTGALEVAGERLPETVRLMSGGGGEAPLEVAPIDVDSTDEIGEVARAFDQVHREAVRLAANEAALRGNINAMFVNLSRRSQTLVERQIRLIDDLEQGEQDSERLANLFQMDHLATRMRRNSENLLVLAGHELSRRWSEPVALVNVLRAAVSEIEHYERVIPDIQSGISVRGQAVNDVVHLLSELAENATTFSPAESLVHVSGYPLNSGGVLLDITDQGVGMGSEEIAHANWRLDNPPVVDVAVSRRMGLFVVARLAARHGIHVRLRPASKGGLTALVWLPDEVITHTATSLADLRPMGESSPSGATSWLDTGLAVEQDEDQAAATWPAAPKRTPRPAPARLGRPGQLGQPGEAGEPGQPGRGDAAAPDGPVPDASPAVPVLPAVPVQSANGTGTPRPGAGTPGSDSPARRVVLPPAESTGRENRLPIFESVESDWFRRGGQPVSRPAAEQEAEVAETSWSSPADAGWQAAEAVRAPVFADTTEAGLPKRVPKANLVPGGAGPLAQAPAVPDRSASQTRQRLASFQQGIRKARSAGPGDDTHFGDEADRAS